MIKIKPTLLYVEDDIEILNDITFLLKEYFSEIYTAVDGIEALDTYHKQKPNIVLLDINIPKITGLEVAKKIRQEDSAVKILFLTAYSDKDKLIDAINIGASSYLIKPFKITELKEAITNIISKTIITNEVVLKNNFIWNREKNEIFYEDKEFKLTKKEVLLLSLLNENRQNFFTACDISTEIFLENNKDSKCNNAVQLLSRFKNKILNHFEVEEFFIQNIYGMGYKLL